MATHAESLSLVEQLGPQFAARAAGHDADKSFVKENYEDLKIHRVFSALVPKDLGGGGWSHAGMCAFLRGIAGHCGSTALALSMHQHLVAAQVWNHLHGRPGRQMLERVAGKELVLVSTGARDWMESNGQVVKESGGFRVSARKAFASGSPAGNVLVTSAPYEDPKEGWQVLHFPVPMSAEGVRIEPDWDTLGMRATGSNTVVLDGVRVPEEAVVLRRPRGAFHPVWNVIITVAMPLIMSVYLGVADAAAALARKRAQQAKEHDPTLAILLGELENLRTTAELAVESMVALANGFDFQPELSRADAMLVRKSIAATAVLQTVEKALEVCGGAGFYRELGLERMLRDVHAGPFHPLPEPKQKLFTGRVALGLDPISGESIALAAAAA